MTNGETEYDLPKEDMVRVHDPDRSRLSHLYMEAGRTINVYDWFEAFAVSLEGEANDPVQDAIRWIQMSKGAKRSGDERYMRGLCGG